MKALVFRFIWNSPSEMRPWRFPILMILKSSPLSMAALKILYSALYFDRIYLFEISCPLKKSVSEKVLWTLLSLKAPQTLMVESWQRVALFLKQKSISLSTPFVFIKESESSAAKWETFAAQLMTVFTGCSNSKLSMSSSEMSPSMTSHLDL